MALDPARFVTADCSLGQAIQSSITQQNKALVNANAGLSGDPVTTGLGVLAQVSTAIRVGQQALPGLKNPALFGQTYNLISGIAPDQIAAGGTAVLSTIGVPQSSIDAIMSINPSIAFNGIGQAQNVFQQVKNGGFTSSSIQSVGTSLQSLQTLSSKVFGVNAPTTASVVKCGANPYAMDLINDRAPKSKFLFVVQFVFNAPYSNTFQTSGKNTAFFVKQSTRPKIDFEYDDVNMYNFRTKVPKRTIYNPISMTFYDDNTNNVTQFYNLYLQAMSPISNIGGTTSGGTATISNSQPADTFAEDSMTDILTDQVNAAASLGPLQNNNVTLLSAIRLFHVYGYGKSMTVYNFFNPKITTFTPDDLTMMESSNGSEMQFEFTYDSLFIIPEYSLTNTAPFDISQLSGEAAGALYTISPAFGATQPASAITGVNNQLTTAISNNSALTSAPTSIVTSPTPSNFDGSILGSGPVSSTTNTDAGPSTVFF